MSYLVRVTDPERKDFIREYCFLPSVTFEVLYRYIQRDLDFSPEYLMSFFLSDAEWSRGLELTLIDVEGDAVVPAVSMATVEVGSVLKRAGERMILVYDLLQDRELRIEILSVENVATEPMMGVFECVKAVGKPPSINFEEGNLGDIDYILQQRKKREEK